MPEEGPLIATGRAADVYAYGDDHVLRRYRTPHDSTYETNAMQYLAAHGYPVPAVLSSDGPDMVMERLDGVTMLSDLEKHPWRLLRYARICAEMLQRLHEIPAPAWMGRRHDTGDVIVHLDLHPDNIMITSRGPVVIDWSNVGVGDGDIEVADLWLILHSANAPVSGISRVIVLFGRGLMIRGILKHFDRDAIRRALPAAHANRSRDRNMGADELQRMNELVEAEAL